MSPKGLDKKPKQSRGSKTKAERTKSVTVNVGVPRGPPMPAGQNKHRIKVAVPKKPKANDYVANYNTMPNGTNPITQSLFCFPAAGMPYVPAFSKGNGVVYHNKGRSFFYNIPATEHLEYYSPGISAIPAILKSPVFSTTNVVSAGNVLVIPEAYSVAEGAPNVATGAYYTLSGDYSCFMDKSTNWQATGPLVEIGGTGAFETFNDGYNVLPSPSNTGCNWSFSYSTNRPGTDGETYRSHLSFLKADGGTNGSSTSTTLPLTSVSTLSGGVSFNHAIPANTARIVIEHQFVLNSPLRLTSMLVNINPTADLTLVSDMKAVVWPAEMVSGWQDLFVNGSAIMGGQMNWFQNTTPTLTRGGHILAASAPSGFVEGPFPGEAELTSLLPDVARFSAEHGLVTLAVPTSGGIGSLENQYWTERSLYSINTHFTRSYGIFSSSTPQSYSLKCLWSGFGRSNNPWMMVRSKNAPDVTDSWEFAARAFRGVVPIMPNKSHFNILAMMANALKALPNWLKHAMSDVEAMSKHARATSDNIRAIL